MNKLDKHVVKILFLILLSASLSVLSACGTPQEDSLIHVSVSDLEHRLNKASIVKKTDETGYVCVRASFDDNGDYEEQMMSLLKHFYAAYPDFLVYTSHGKDLKVYQNRYSGALAWIDPANSLLQITLFRDEERKAAVEVLYVPNKMCTYEGTVDELDEFTLHITVSDTKEGLYLYWAYPNTLMYPNTIEGVRIGQKIRVYYLDSNISFGTTPTDRSCHIKALEIIE